MKKVLIVIAILILAVAGGVYYTYFMPKPEKINPSLVQQTFANASEAQRSAVSNAVAAIQAGDYDKALEILDELQYDPDLTDDQQAAVMDLVAQLESKTSEKAAQTAEPATEESANESGQGAAEAASQAVQTAAEKAQKTAKEAAGAAAEAAQKAQKQAAETTSNAVEGVKEAASGMTNLLKK